jgi:DNA-binding transcriptional MerR regulator
MTIGEVSKKYDITVETLRYYERIGLIPKINRKENGIRDFTQTDCEWVYFIKCMRKAGMSIEILIEYVSMVQQGEATVLTRKVLLLEQREMLAERIEELQSILERLDKKIDGYEEGMVAFEERLK